MVRRILMTGDKARYMEKRPVGSEADDRMVMMSGENATYEENVEVVNIAASETWVELSDGESPLSSPEAMRMWAIAEGRGWVDSDHNPRISENKAALLADVMAECLHLQPKYKAFEELWGISELSSKRSKAVNQRYFPDLYKEMKEVLR